jgi:hypothetical protein
MISEAAKLSTASAAADEVAKMSAFEGIVVVSSA